MKQIYRQNLSDRMKKNNPMKNPITAQKVANKLRGHSPWNKGLKLHKLTEERKKQNSIFMKEYRKTHANPMKDLETCKKMSNTRKRKIKDGIIVFSKIDRERNAKQMRINRHNEDFNKKMFLSLTKQISNPHKMVKQFLLSKQLNNFITNLPMLFGNTWGSIDEASEKDKIAIFVDGEYWHNYPKGRRWDKYCTTFLKNKGWRVIRIWAKQINKDSLEKLLSV